MSKKTIYEVLWSVDAYVCRDWFENECFANQFADENECKERIINKYIVDKDFIKDNRISFSDDECWTDEEWDIVKSHGLLDI